MKALLNSKGTSLVQIMISIALMGIVSLGFATMMKQMSASQQMIQAKQDLANVVDEVQMMFSSSATCFSGIPSGATFDVTQASVRFPSPPGQPPFSFNGQPFVYRLNGSQSLQANSDLRGSSLIINNIQIVNADLMGTDSSGHSVYKAKLIGQFAVQSERNPIDLNTRILTSGYFVVNPSNRRITGCSDFNTVDLHHVSSTCAALGGVYNATTKKCSMPVNMAELCTQLNGTLNNDRCEISPAGGGAVSTVGSWFSTGTAIHSAFAYQYTRCPANITTACTKGQNCISGGAGIGVAHGLYMCL